MVKRYLIIAFMILIVTSKSTIYDEGQSSFPIPKILWVFWDNGYEGAKTFTKLCILNMIHFTQKSGWELKFLTLQNITTYLSQEAIIKIQYMMAAPHREILKVKQSMADIYRFFLLYEHGGFWIDINSFFLQDLSWLQNIDKQPGIINKIGKYPEHLGFTQEPARDYRNTVYDRDLKMYIGLFPGHQSWAIASQKKSLFLTDLLNNMIYIISKPRQEVMKDVQNLGIKLNISLLQYFVAANFPMTMTFLLKQNQIDLYPDRFETKYAVQYYKTWSLGCQDSSFFIWYLYQGYWHERDTMYVYDKMKDMNINTFYRFNNNKAHFFKFTGIYYQFANDRFDNLVNQVCTSKQFKFQKDSIFYEFLLKYGQDIPQINKFLKLNNATIDLKLKQTLCSKQSQDTFPKSRIIWAYIEDSSVNKTSLLSRICRNNILHYAAERDWDVIFFSQQNITNFISVAGHERINKIFKNQNLERKQQISIAKLMLLHQRGGILINQNTFFLQSLNWLENIASNPEMSKKFQYEPQFLAFRSKKIQNNSINQAQSQSSSIKIFLPNLQISNFATNPGYHFIEDTLKYLQKQSSISTKIQFQKLLQNLFSIVLEQRQKKMERKSNVSTIDWSIWDYRFWIIQFQQGNQISFTFDSTEGKSKFQLIPFLHDNSADYLAQNKLENAPFLKFNSSGHKITQQLLMRLPDLLCKGDIKRINYNSIFNEKLMRLSGQEKEIYNLKVINSFGVTSEKEKCSTIIQQLKNIKSTQLKQINQNIEKNNQEIDKLFKSNKTVLGGYYEGDKQKRIKIIKIFLLIFIGVFVIFSIIYCYSRRYGQRNYLNIDKKNSLIQDDQQREKTLKQQKQIYQQSQFELKKESQGQKIIN